MAFQTINQYQMDAIRVHCKKYVPYKAPLIFRDVFLTRGTPRLRAIALVCYQLGIRQSSILSLSLVCHGTSYILVQIAKIKGTSIPDYQASIFCNCSPQGQNTFCSLHGPFSFQLIHDTISATDLADTTIAFSVQSHSFRVSLACEMQRARTQSPQLKSILTVKRINYHFVWANPTSTTLFGMYSTNFEQYQSHQMSIPIFSIARLFSHEFFSKASFPYHSFKRNYKAESLRILELFNLEQEELNNIQLAA